MRVAHWLQEIETPLEDAAGAVLLRPAQLFDGGIGVEPRQHRCPAQPTAGLVALLRHPTVVGVGKRRLRFRVQRDIADEEGGEEHLDVHAHPVHIVQAALQVFQLPSGSRRVMFIVPHRPNLQAALHQPEPAPVGVEVRVLDRLLGRRHRGGGIPGKRTFERLPSGFGLVYMRIGVDNRHRMPPVLQRPPIIRRSVRTVRRARKRCVNRSVSTLLRRLSYPQFDTPAEGSDTPRTS